MAPVVFEDRMPAFGEPIAIVGIACRLPGENDTPDALWKFLSEKRTAKNTVPPSRFNIDSFYHPNPKRPGSIVSKGGYFLSEDVYEFDPTFFGIGLAEATELDPQQRKLLEVVYESFESAGATLEKMAGSKTACFVGNFTSDFKHMQTYDMEYSTAYSATGSGETLLSNRISHTFNLLGPSMTIDTACSSSMYALHLACSAIARGDADAAVIGGANLILGLSQQLVNSKLGVLSATSECHTFDARADGYGRADGVGAVYLKPLSAAIAAGDPIRGVIRGTAFNANGKTNGITNPSVAGQVEVIRHAYRQAGLSIDGTGYFECHGTGTPVGDPIEVEAIGRVFAAERSVDNPLLIGSIKSSLGHSEAVSGISSIIKTALILERGIITPAYGFDIPNPKIDFDGWRVKVVTENTPWPQGSIRRASVNSFGYGGSNAHCILESAASLVPGYTVARARESHPAYPDSYHQQPDQRGKFLLAFSAHSDATLDKQISNIHDVAQNYDPVDLAYTLGVRRSRFFYRAFAIGESGRSFAAGVTKANKSLKPPTLGFVFTGQGAQWPEMGVGLMDSFPFFLSCIQKYDGWLRELDDAPSWSIEGSLREPAETSRINEPELAQPICTAVQIALVDLLAEWNVRPIATIGHSSGEIAAAYASGHLSAREAIIVSYYRGLEVSRDTQKGAMMAVGLSASEVAKYITGSSITIACENSPESVTLSGVTEEIEGVYNRLKKEAKGVFCRVLKVGKAYHSSQMKTIGPVYKKRLRGYLGKKKRHLLERKIMASSVMAELVPEKTVLDASYWQKNLESPVLFHQALETLIQQVPEIDCLIELGPHSALAGPIRQITKSIGKGDKVTYLPTLSRGKDSAEDVLTLAGQLFLKDYPVDLEHVNAVQDRAGRTLVDLPRYGWTYGEPLKHEPRPSRELRNRKYPRHDLLGSRVLGGCTSEIVWRNLLSVKNVPWLEDHQIGHEILFPAAGYVSMAAEALTQALDDNEPGRKDVAGYRFRELAFKAALALTTDGSVEIIFRIQPITTGTRGSIETYVVSAASLSNDKWVENFQATVSPEVHPAESTVTPSLDLLTRQYPTKFWYDIMGKAGLHYGTTFKGLDNIRTYPGCSEATATTYTTITDAVMPNQSRYLVHPTVFDNCLQLGEIAALAGQVKNFHVGFIPVEIEELWLSTSGVSPDENRLDISSQGRTEGKIISADLQLRSSSKNNNLILDLKGVKCVPFEIRSSVPDRSPYCRAIWKPDTKMLTLTQATSILCPGRNGMDQLLLDMRKLDRVLLLCVLLLYPRVRDITVTPTQPFLQDYLTWFKSLAQLALSGQVLKAFDTAQWSRDEQEAEFKKLLGEMTHVTEALLLERMYKHLPAILAGETSFLSIALEDNLLSRHYAEGLGFKGAQAQMAKALDLLAHENPTMDILEVGGGTGGSTKIALEVLRGGKHLKRYRTYTFTDITPGFLAAAQDRFENCSDMKYGTLNVEEDIENQDFEPGSYDLIVASNVLHATLSIKTTLKNIRRLLRPGGRLLLLETTRDQVYVTIVLGLLRDWWRGKLEGRYPTPFLSKEQWSESLKATGFSGADLILDDYPSPANTASIIVSTAVPEEPPVTSREELIVIVRDQPTPLSQAIETAAKAKNWNVTTQIFNASAIPKNARIISLVEVGQPLLANVDETSWLSLKRLISTSSSLLWVTSGNLIAGARPEYSLMLGLTRGIRLEEPHISLTNFDLEDENPDPAAAGELIVRMEERLRVKNQTQNEDVDFLVKGGVVHTCRFYPDEGLNEEFMQVVETREGKRFEPKSLGGWGNVKLKVGDYGLLDSLFLSEESVKDVLDPGAVEVEVKFWGLTAKSLAVVTGKSNSSTAMQGTGIVRRIGSAVESLKAGDEVVFVHPGNLEMVIQCREILCQKIQRGLEGTASVPVPYLTAQYGLQHLARLDRDEIVLIHFSFGGISEAAIQIALQIGSLVFVTVDSPSAYDYVTGKFGSQIRSIFSSPATFERDLNRATAGHGVDVVFGEAGLYESWRFLAPFGRLVQVGRGDRGDLEKVSTPRVVPGNASLLRVELAELVKCKPELAGSLLKDAISVLNSGSIRLPETTSFPPTELQAAFQHLSNATGTTLISYVDKETTIVKVQPQQKQAHFDPTAWYLLVGCLGGLGISMTYWMLERGARNFVFLSRSGANSSRSVALLEDIKKKGGVAVAVKGDITNINDVQRAIGSASGPIKGVVQGVMALRDSLFDSMTTDEYLSVIRPKMTGTLNLHNALLSAPLDFFFALSSIASQTGTATQANYCSANSFLDFFGRHREALGLPITALGLGMVLEVGHAADNPNVEEALSRSGVHSIYEHEFHQMLEVILRPRDTESEVPEQGQGHGGYDPLSRSLLVTGFEPGKLRDLLDQGFGGGTLWKTDPRLKMVFMAAVDAQRRQLDSSTPNSSSSNGGNGTGGEKANNVFNRLGALRGDAAIDFFQGIVSEQLSRLLLIPIEQLDVGKALANFGVDSMIDAELRNWLYKELRTEVSFVEIRASGTCIRSLAGRIVEAHGLGADAMDIDGPAVTNGNRVAHGNGNGTLKRKAEDTESANGRPEKQGKRI